MAAGAVGVVTRADAAPLDALGQYIPFGREFQNIPAVYLDRVPGQQLQKRVDAAPTTVKLTLTADMAAVDRRRLTTHNIK